MNVLNHLVEAQILRVSLMPDSHSLEIELISADKQRRYTIVATGVDDFLAEDLRLNSIVDEVIQYPNEMKEKDSVSRLYYLLRGQELSEGDSWPFLDFRLSEIREGRLQFWELRPVIGAVIQILASNIYVRAAV